MTKRISPFTAPGGGNQSQAHVYFFSSSSASNGTWVKNKVYGNPNHGAVDHVLANKSGVVGADGDSIFVPDTVESLWAATKVGGDDHAPVWGSTIALALIEDLSGQGPTEKDTYLSVVGTPDDPITDEDTARPTGVAVYWICANGVTPTNAQDGDLIFNADA